MGNKNVKRDTNNLKENTINNGIGQNTTKDNSEIGDNQNKENNKNQRMLFDPKDTSTPSKNQIK